MKTIKYLLAIIFVCSSVISFAQKSFEGKVVFEVESGGEKQSLNYFVKDNKFRLETPDAMGSMIYDSETNKMMVLMPEQKMYMEMPVDIPKEIADSELGNEGSFSKTGQTKNILGYDCEKFEFKDKDTKGEAWMTKELGGFMLFDDPSQQGGSANWKSEILAAGYFPMAVNELDESGNVVSTFNVKEINPESLSSDMFKAPGSYKKFEMPNMNMDTNK